MAIGKYREWLEPDGLLRLEAWARDGLTDEQIAAKIGINRTTLYDWKRAHPDIANALKVNKEIVDVKVENALLKRALGFRYKEITREVDELGRKKVKEVEREVLPDVAAAFIWLKNRRPDLWRDKPRFDADAETLGKLDELLHEFTDAVKPETT